jgi:hypothetical protein
VLLVFAIKVQCMLDLIAQTFTIRRLAVAVAAMFLLVYVASSTTLGWLDLHFYGPRIDALTPV